MLQRAALGAVVLAGASFLIFAVPATAEPARAGGRSVGAQQPPSFDNTYELDAGATVVGTLEDLAVDDLLVYETLTVAALEPAAAGDLTISGEFPDGTFAFTADARFAGTARADYTGETAKGERVTASVVFRVRAIEPANRAPVAVADTVTVAPGSSVRIRPMANDQDPDDGDLLTLTGVSPALVSGVAVDVQGTTLRIRTPVNADRGQRRFRYTITDRRGAATAGTLTVTVAPRSSSNPNPNPTPTGPGTTAPGGTPGLPTSTTAAGPGAGSTPTDPDATTTSGNTDGPADSTTTPGDRPDPDPVDSDESTDFTPTGSAGDAGDATTASDDADTGSSAGVVAALAALAVVVGAAVFVGIRRARAN
jgi:hypothetical protein